MRHALRAGSLMMTLAVVGCGRTAETSGPAQPRHGGILLELPDRLGFVELVVEPAEAPSTPKRPAGKVVAYFLDPRGAPLAAPAPAEVSFADLTGTPQRLYPQSAGTPGEVRFETGPLPSVPGDEPTGRLSARLGDRTVSVESRPR